MTDSPLIGFCPLASGSKGNCLYVGTEETKILIDAGLSRKATLSRLAEIGVSIEDIDAILVTHDHIDHILGLRLLAEKYQIPVLANLDTAKACSTYHSHHFDFKIFSSQEPFAFKDLEITPFSIQHDTLDPVGFVIKTPKHKIGIAADLGVVTTSVTQALKDCDVLYVEANHEPDWVHASPRPASYKQRVLSRLGHLSNKECAELLLNIAHSNLERVFLAHLSSECNSETKALEVITEILESKGMELPLLCAPQHQISASFSFTKK